MRATGGSRRSGRAAVPAGPRSSCCAPLRNRPCRDRPRRAPGTPLADTRFNLTSRHRPASPGRIRSVAAAVGGAVFAFTGALQVTQDFEGTHNTIDTTAEYLVTGALPVALALTLPMYLLLGRLARAPRARIVAVVPQIVLALMCVISVINGEDASFFNAVAPICLATWLGSSVVIARGLRRTRAVPAAVAFALPALLIATFMLSPIGGAMLTGAYWIAVASLLTRGALVRPGMQPVAA